MSWPQNLAEGTIKQQRTWFLFSEADEAVYFHTIYPAFTILPEVPNSSISLPGIETGKAKYWDSESKFTRVELIMQDCITGQWSNTKTFPFGGESSQLLRILKDWRGRATVRKYFQPHAELLQNRALRKLF